MSELLAAIAFSFAFSTRAVPATSSFWVGELIPMPTLPDDPSKNKVVVVALLVGAVKNLILLEVEDKAEA